MRRLIEIATKRRVTIVMFTVAVVLFGMVSLSRLNLNLLPDISYPTITIRTELTGAAPVAIDDEPGGDRLWLFGARFPRELNKLR